MSPSGPPSPSAFPQDMCPERAGPCLSSPNPARGLREPLLHFTIVPGQGESSFGVSLGCLGAPWAGTLSPRRGSTTSIYRSGSETCRG